MGDPPAFGPAPNTVYIDRTNVDDEPRLLPPLPAYRPPAVALLEKKTGTKLTPSLFFHFRDTFFSALFFPTSRIHRI